MNHDITYTAAINILTILIPLIIFLRNLDKRLTHLETKTRRGCQHNPDCPLND